MHPQSHPDMPSYKSVPPAVPGPRSVSHPDSHRSSDMTAGSFSGNPLS